ncbi:Retrovirus-related Pol polyprotein from transposon RE2 [Vitis vinifera]|uniref:Retrovirus-related Pol polyprotein from transposon RE2 n=1 Tax=Vitis vinifera TaxID=29760 RepID=A0A438D678_VITVI|nr:Retrovirus-related Pol polyprotein from transposon RE2 [Vitis vinifera]
MITSEKLEANIPEVDRVQWRKIDAQLCSVLWQSVDPKILLHLRAYKTCFKFWTQAKGLYTNDIQRLYKIASLKEEFLTVMPLTPDVRAQQTQLDKFFMFLLLLASIRILSLSANQILGSSSVSSLDDVFARLPHISSTQTLPFDSTSNSSVLVSQTSSREGHSGTRGRGQRPHCTYCNKLGHTRNRCYQLHGRPPHTAHVAQSSDSPLPQPPSSSASQASVASMPSLVMPLPALPTHLLLDPGYWFGPSSAFSTSHSVLYTPECPFNLISISKITRTLNCSITISDKFVTLQDRSTGKTIGIGRESQGLYHLTSDSSPAVCISTDAPLLIHNRLGHPSLSKFQKMVPRFSTLSSLPCESCQLGKHTRVSFPKRLNNRAKSPFELVHTDVGTSFRQSHEVPLLGIFQTSEGLSCYSLETHRYFISADVTFFEDSPFFSTTSESLPVSEVLPIPIVSHLMLCLLDHFRVYHHRPRVVTPLPFAEAPADSLPIPSASPAPALPSLNDLPIVVRKGAPMKLFPIQGWRQANVKVGPDGQVDRLKARLVAKGYTQVYGSDYGDTFSPVAKIASVRLLLSMAAMCSWPLYQLDIKNASFMVIFAEEVYMEQPPGFVAQGESGLVCSTADHSVFYHHNSLGQCIYLVVYVDNIVITGSDQDDSSIQFWCGPFPKEVCFRHPRRNGMLDCKTSRHTYGSECQTCTRTGEPLGDPERYRRLVGKLNYLTITRPDISFPVSVVSQFLQSPCDSHWDVVIRILRYIKSTPGQGMLYENKGHTQVVVTQMQIGLAHPQIGRSTSGYCVLLEVI